MTDTYDVIVVGARCAGAPTAMLLARRGHRVLLVDRATFPSDTVSTHLVQPPGVDALARWGLLDRLAATGCPPITRFSFDLGPAALAGTPGTAYCARRTVLDALLVEAAAEAGVEVREGFTVDGLVTEDGDSGGHGPGDRPAGGPAVTGVRGHGRAGGTVTERARFVVGADGKHSRVAAAVGAEAYDVRPAAEGAYYAYWSGVPCAGAELTIRPGRVVAAFPTHDDQTLVLAAWPAAEMASFRADVEGNMKTTLDQAPDLAARVREGTRESRFHASGDLVGFFRRPYGPGWALVGDAGYTIDPSTAQGISDAFLDAEGLAGALDAALTGRRVPDEALADWHRARDERVRPMYELTFQLAALEPPPPELQALLMAAAGNQRAMDSFARMFTGVMPVPDFFAPEHVEGIFRDAA